MSVTLPASVSESAFSRAIDGFTAALGTGKVLTSDAARADFRDRFQHPAGPNSTAARMVSGSGGPSASPATVNRSTLVSTFTLQRRGRLA